MTFRLFSVSSIILTFKLFSKLKKPEDYWTMFCSFLFPRCLIRAVLNIL